MVNSSSDSKVVTRTLVGRDGIFGSVLKDQKDLNIETLIICMQKIDCKTLKRV